MFLCAFIGVCITRVSTDVHAGPRSRCPHEDPGQFQLGGARREEVGRGELLLQLLANYRVTGTPVEILCVEGVLR